MSKSTDPPQKNRSAILTSLVLVLVYVAITLPLFVFGNLSNSIEMQKAAFVLSLSAIVYVFSAVIIRTGKNSLGGWLMIINLTIGIPLISLFILNLGWASLIAIPLLVVWIARQTLPGDKIVLAIVIGIVSGFSAVLIDLFGPAQRVSLPYTEYLVPAILLALIFITIIIIYQRFQTFTFQTKVLILFLIAAIIPLSILAILDNQLTRNTITEAANQSLYSTGTQTTHQIDSFMRSTKQSLQAEAQFTGLREFLTNIANGDFAFSTDVAVALATLGSKDSAHILSYALLDRYGGVRVTYPVTPVPQGFDTVDVVPPYLGLNFAVENGMRTSLISGQPYSSPVLFDENNQASIYFVTPVYNILDQTIPVGYLLVEYNATILQEVMENQNELAGVDSFGVLFDENQLHLAHGTDPSTLYKTIAPLPIEDFERLVEDGRLPNLPYSEHSTELPDLSEKINNAVTEPFFTAIDVATGDRINQVAVARIETQPWQVGFFQPQDVYLSIANQQTRNTIILLLVIAGVVAITSIGATRTLVAPINTLTQLVEHIAAGDLALQAPVISRDEIGRLAIAFNAMTSQVRSLLSGLELQVINRTRELERRAIQLQTAAEVARDASSLQNLDDLLDRTVNLIQSRFNFYHAGIFLLDDRRDYAILRATNSEGGKQMLRSGHRLKVGQTGIVGYVTSRGEPRIALDVDIDAAHFAHTFLPNTRSEIALPLIVGGSVIGALDVQSTESNAFDEGDISVLQVLADQIAVAIENTRLLSEVQQTVNELQTAYGEFTQESWQKWAQHENRSTGFRYRGTGIEPTTQKSPEAILALKQGKLIKKTNLHHLDSDLHPDERSSIAIPIQLRDQTFGVINIQFETSEPPNETINLIETISNRLAAALESARLYEETQRRAAQEQVTGEISSRIRESLDIDSVLKTAVQEIGQNLNLHDVSVQIDLNSNQNQEKES